MRFLALLSLNAPGVRFEASRWNTCANLDLAVTLAARLKDFAGLSDLAKQVAVGNFLHIPFAFLPSFYLTQEVCTHGRNASPLSALQACHRNIWADCVAAWAIWIPGHAVFFSVPLWLRLPVNHAMSFAYVCILSFSRGDTSRRKVEEHA